MKVTLLYYSRPSNGSNIKGDVWTMEILHAMRNSRGRVDNVMFLHITGYLFNT